jgi:phosphoenolpyruvate carboxykinase (GTP)
MDGINRTGLNLTDTAMAGLLTIDTAEWAEAIAGQDDFMKPYGSRMPRAMWNQHNELARRIQDSAGIAVKR